MTAFHRVRRSEGLGWLDTRHASGAWRPTTFETTPVVETREHHPLALNYTSGTSGKSERRDGLAPQHVHEPDGALWMHHHMTPCADRYLWVLPMFHANGWTFVWTVTAVGGTHVCLRKADPKLILFEAISGEKALVTMFCAAPTVLIGIAGAPEDVRGAPLHAACASSRPARRPQRRRGGAHRGRARLDDPAHVYGLTEVPSPIVTICEARPENTRGWMGAAGRWVIKVRQGVELSRQR